ncbi:hypothetical protein CC80DRAFT_496290 [Byssothecium circinans]|uniref:Uncharacterized protein n=1 Tax=Byssothecium circinans TaxID=147558 RepID=A0A6A5THQ9_9PLEO|nr:hypothetical protein CC80DRAFT_496290 [Byssothecium circinans]
MNCVWSGEAQERRLYRQEPTLGRNGTEPSGTVKYCSVQHTPSAKREAGELDVRLGVGIPHPLNMCTTG